MPDDYVEGDSLWGSMDNAPIYGYTEEAEDVTIPPAPEPEPEDAPEGANAGLGPGFKPLPDMRAVKDYRKYPIHDPRMTKKDREVWRDLIEEGQSRKEPRSRLARIGKGLARLINVAFKLPKIVIVLPCEICKPYMDAIDRHPRQPDHGQIRTLNK